MLSRALSRQASATDAPYRSAGQIDLYLLIAEPYSMQPAASTAEKRTSSGISLNLLDLSQEFQLWAGNGAFLSYIHGIVRWTSFKEHSIREVKAMVEFDYNALAELFPNRGRMRSRQSFGYKRFAKAAQAIRFAMEDMPRACLVGAFLEVNERRYGSDDIRRLYESAEYPLTRRGTS